MCDVPPETKDTLIVSISMIPGIRRLNEVKKIKRKDDVSAVD